MYIKEMLSRGDKIDGVFASVERFALSTYSVCKELKIAIPDDLKVICFSNIYTAEFLSPSLSTVSQPAFEMGATAAETLFKHLDKKKIQLANENIVIKSTLMARESSIKK